MPTEKVYGHVRSLKSDAFALLRPERRGVSSIYGVALGVAVCLRLRPYSIFYFTPISVEISDVTRQFQSKTEHVVF